MNKSSQFGSVFKENGKAQRRGVKLSLNIANALRERIFRGKTLYPKQGFFHVYLPSKGAVNPIKISNGTLSTWITRANVIPEIGTPLRAFLATAREEYRIEKNDKKIHMLLEEAEIKISEMLKINTKIPLTDKNGNGVIDKETGEYIYYEDAQLLNVQLNLAKFVLDRLGGFKRSNKHFKKEYPKIFSLSDLRDSKKK